MQTERQKGGSELPRPDGFTYPDLHVIRALVILLVEDLKVVLSGRDQAEGEKNGERKRELLLDTV